MDSKIETRIERWAAAIAPDDYLAEQAERAATRMRQGWSRAHARQNQLLPYAGTFLSPGDALRLSSALNLTASATDAEQVEIAGAALLSAMMTTGRGVDVLILAKYADSPHAAAATLCASSTWHWWFAPARPSSPQLFRNVAEPASAERAALIPLPCTDRTRTLLRMLVPDPIAGEPVFPVPLDKVVQVLRRYVLAAGVTAKSRRIETWLFQRLLLKRGGDLAIAAMITGQEPAIAETVLHYTAMDADDIQTHVAEAFEGFDTVPPTAPTTMVTKGRIGSRFAPVDADVQRLGVALSIPLDPPGGGRRRDPVSVHNAITTYTIVLTNLTTGCRPTANMLLDEQAIDEATGFLIRDDKPTRDNFKSRIVWVSGDCREQLQLYRAHLERLVRRWPAAAAAAASGLPFYLSRDMFPSPVTRTTLGAVLRSHGWPYPLNAGRHFLRSALVGKVSTETLHALLGHWHIGSETWGSASGLDPMAYRDDLAAELVPLFRRLNWVPRAGL